MKFVEKKKVGWPGPAGNGYNARRGGRHKIFTNERSEAVALRRWEEVYAGKGWE